MDEDGKMSLQEFKASIVPKKPKVMKISGSWGVYDAYKAIRKNGWFDIGRPVKEHEFYYIIREVNKLLAEDISMGETVVFPSRMGKLELRKFEKGVSIVKGKIKNTYPIDWAETWKLWYENEEARKSKTLLRDEQRWVYCVRYDKFDANYENRKFYQFALNRHIKTALKENIKQGKIDTLW